MSNLTAEQKAIDNNTDTPESFSAALAPNYLGSPAVVGGIVATFVENMITCLQARANGTMKKGEMVAEMAKDAERFSRVFSGEDPDYVPIKGWNSRDAGLSAYLKVDLGHYWQSQRATHHDDPYQVSHAWLLWAVFDAITKHDDEDLTALVMGDRIQKLVRILTGSAARK